MEASRTKSGKTNLETFILVQQRQNLVTQNQTPTEELGSTLLVLLV
jgi:hypothetical protein